MNEASKKGHLHVVRTLLAAHAQVDVKDMKQKSPLQLAAFGSHPEVFLDLESAGADALRINLNVEGCGIVAVPVHAHSRAPPVEMATRWRWTRVPVGACDGRWT